MLLPKPVILSGSPSSSSVRRGASGRGWDRCDGGRQNPHFSLLQKSGKGGQLATFGTFFFFFFLPPVLEWTQEHRASSHLLSNHCASPHSPCVRGSLPQKRKTPPLSVPAGLSSLLPVRLYCFTQCRKMLSPRQATSFCQGHGSLEIRDCAWASLCLDSGASFFLREQLPLVSPASYTKAAEWLSSAL